MKVLIVSPHPDDEVLGVGGTIARLASEGNDITVAIVTKGWEPLFPNSQVKQVRDEANQANSSLGVKSLRFMDLPVTKLIQIPKNELNREFETISFISYFLLPATVMAAVNGRLVVTVGGAADSS